MTKRTDMNRLDVKISTQKRSSCMSVWILKEDLRFLYVFSLELNYKNIRRNENAIEMYQTENNINILQRVERFLDFYFAIRDETCHTFSYLIFESGSTISKENYFYSVSEIQIFFEVNRSK